MALPAGDEVVGGDLSQLWAVGLAARLSDGTARIEGAAGGRGGGYFIGQRSGAVAPGVGVGQWYGSEQSLSVRMGGVAIECLGRGSLDDLSEIHDGNLVGEMLDDGEVVGDEEVTESELILEVG